MQFQFFIFCKSPCLQRNFHGRLLSIRVFSADGHYLNNMLFLTSELANKAEITILSARDTTRAWVPGRCIMGWDVGVYKIGYNTWLSSGLKKSIKSTLSNLIYFTF